MRELWVEQSNIQSSLPKKRRISLESTPLQVNRESCEKSSDPAESRYQRERCALSSQQLNRRIATQERLIEEVKAWENKRNAGGIPCDCRFTTRDARIKLKKLYPTPFKNYFKIFLRQSTSLRKMIFSTTSNISRTTLQMTHINSLCCDFSGMMSKQKELHLPPLNHRKPPRRVSFFRRAVIIANHLHTRVA